MASDTVITALKIVGFILLGVSIIFMIGILFLWRQSRNRKRAHRQTLTSQLDTLDTAKPNALQSRPSRKQKDKSDEAKRKQNLAWGVVDEEAGEKDADEMGGIGTLSTDAIRRMGIARTDSGLQGTAVLHRAETRSGRPAVRPVQTLHSQTTSVASGIGSGNGPRSPPKALAMSDSHRKLSDNPFSNRHASPIQQTGGRRLNESSSPLNGRDLRPSRPLRPSEAGSPLRTASQQQPYPAGSGIKFPDATTQKAVAPPKPDPRGRAGPAPY